MNKELFVSECEKLGKKIDEDVLSKFGKYYDFLVSCNEKFNLTAITNEEDVYLKHFYDSISVVRSGLIEDGIELCDFGTGAGFPGMVIAILFDKVSVTLVESNGKKCGFLNELVKLLDLKNVNIVCDRAEDFSKRNRETFDIVTCRAVSSLKVICELGSAMVKVNGSMIFLKSSYDSELKEADRIINDTGFMLSNVIDFTLPDGVSNRSIIILKKVRVTPEMYPRSYSVIIKESKKK